MLTIQEQLFERQDKAYADFQSKLIPTLPKDLIIGVRVPVLRALAKGLNPEQAQAFIKQLPHHYYDENLLHAILLSAIKNYDECLEAVESFLPYVDNWAVCDILSPKVFKKNRPDLIEKIRLWSNSTHSYTRRFAMTMLMSHYLDEDFEASYLAIAGAIDSDDYYVNMALAWFYATALAKQWESVIVYLEDNRLSTWVHNKTIQKARESFRITQEQKSYLMTLKR